MDVKQSISDMKRMKKTHVEWAEYFENNPEIEKRYVATGEWDDVAEHRDLIRQYDNVIKLLKTLL